MRLPNNFFVGAGAAIELLRLNEKIQLTRLKKILLFLLLLSGFIILNIFSFNRVLEFSENNQNDFIFFIFLILFGGIHYFWGTIAYLIRPQEIRTKLFFLKSIVFGIFYYALVDQFSNRSFSFIFVLMVLILGFLNIIIINNLTIYKMNRLVSVFILLFASAIFIFSIIFKIVNGAIDTIVYHLLFIYLIFCYFFAVSRLIIELFKETYSFVRQRNFVMIISLFVGNFIPMAIIFISGFSNISLPVGLSSGLSILSPLIIGNAIIKYNQYDFPGFKIFQLNDFKLLLYNIFVALSSGVLLYSLFATSGLIYYKILYLLSAVFIITFLLYSQYFILRKLSNVVYENKDSYAFLTKKIAEVISSSESVEHKLKSIFSEISALCKTESLRLLIFSDSEDMYFLNLSSYVEVLPFGSKVYSLMRINRNIILKYALIQNSETEGKVLSFLTERSSVFAMPAIEKDEVKGAFLIGERTSGGFYSNADIHFFQTATNQLMQLIESDMLYKDYIKKKQYEEDLDNASYVQMRLFPKVALKGRGLNISFFYRPYLRVIGDYFDFFKVDEVRTAIIIGDVSGHGLSTAMVLSAVNSITHAMLQEEKAFEKTFIEINNYLNTSYRGIELITLFIGIFNRETKAMEYINAGHWAPILINKRMGEIRQIEGRSKILGAVPDAEYISSYINLSKDDELILFTDGVMEIYNEKTGSGLNEQKFIEIIRDNIEKDIDGKIIEIEKTIQIHNKDIKDDITIIGVKIH